MDLSDIFTIADLMNPPSRALHGVSGESGGAMNHEVFSLSLSRTHKQLVALFTQTLNTHNVSSLLLKTH